MASVYTTARGKNKKQKAKDQSKDFKNNTASKLNASIRDDAKKVEVPEVRREYGGAAAVVSATYRARVEKERAMAQAAEKSCSAGDECANRVASNGEDIVAAARARCPCQHAIYCNADCQRIAWPGHRDFCKAKRSELAEIAAYEEAERLKRVAEAEAAAAALIKEEEEEG